MELFVLEKIKTKKKAELISDRKRKWKWEKISDYIKWRWQFAIWHKT